LPPSSGSNSKPINKQPNRTQQAEGVSGEIKQANINQEAEISGLDPESGGSTSLLNIGKFLPNYTALHNE
jgi:hypothetical protein